VLVFLLLLLLAVNWIESVSLLPRLLNSISFSAQSSFIQRPLSSFIAIISFYRQRRERRWETLM
jgi:NhaP-type Na+/H+ and K+/H+ antiporter